MQVADKHVVICVFVVNVFNVLYLVAKMVPLHGTVVEFMCK